MKVLITGGSSGIGLEIASLLLEEGHSVSITYNSNKEKAKELEKKGIQTYSFDQSNEESLKKIVEQINLKKFDTLINNACPNFPLTPLRKLEGVELAHYISTGVNAVHTVSQAFVSSRAKQPGRIINVLSAYTLGNTQNQMAPYITLKYALLGLTKCMAKEYLPKKIIVNAISPSMTNTSFLSKTFPEKFIEMAKEDHPSGDIADPKMVAKTVSQMLQFDEFIVGVNLPVTGSPE